MHYLPQWCVLFIDILLCSFAYVLCLFIGSGLFTYGISDMPVPIWARFGIVMLVQLLCYRIFHTYAGIIRYSSFQDIIKVFFCQFLTCTILFGINLSCYLLGQPKVFLTTAILIYFFISFVLMLSWRIGVKTLFERISLSSTHHEKVLIYGSHSAGAAIAKMLRSSEDSKYVPMGFIIDDKDPKVKYLQDMRAYPLSEELFHRMSVNNIKSIIVSPKKLQEIDPTTDLQIFLQHNIRILTTPAFVKWEDPADITDSSAKNMIGKIEDIKVEDLLGRPTININTENVSQIVQDKVVLVTGAAGSIGSELVRQVLLYKPHLVILLDQAESPLHDFSQELHEKYLKSQFLPIIADVRDKARIDDIFHEFTPQVVLHAAAYKHVPLMEDFPCEAILTNVLGTKNVIEAAIQNKAERFLMISTDKAVNPTNVMGASKRIAELYCQSLFRKIHAEKTSSIIVSTTRFGNVLGSNGSVIPHFKKQIAAGGPVTVTHPEITRYFMTIPEACTLVLEAATITNGGEIFIFDMGQPVKIADLAKNMIRLAGLEPGKDIEIIYTGLRQGEKLYEELLNREELTMLTTNEKIKIAKVQEFEFDTIKSQVDHLIATAKTYKSYTTVAEMKSIVPEFISKNSIYEQLDK